MRKIWVVIVAMGFVFAAQADPIFEDDFASGGLGASSSPTGGFSATDNGGPGSAGSVTEAGGAAVLTSGSTKNVYGMLSVNPVSLANAGGVRTTWNIEGYDLKDSLSYMAFTWQTSSAYDAAPELRVMINMTNSLITVTSNGVNVVDSQWFDVSLFDGTNSFSLVVEYTPAQMEFTADFETGSDITFTRKWTLGTPLIRSDETYYHRAFVNGEGKGAITASIGDVLTEPIPEPAVISLIGIFGGGMIFCHRFSSRRKKNSGA